MIVFGSSPEAYSAALVSDAALEEGYFGGDLDRIEKITKAVVAHVRSNGMNFAAAGHGSEALRGRILRERKRELRRVACQAVGIAPAALIFQWVLAALIRWVLNKLMDHWFERPEELLTVCVQSERSVP